ncbi:hypothetical protein KL86PLE_40217 [uncultured Pleomorphomonas sp.]|uniref:Uncharacterized protein n=1 Tax=uncultured Pleomorphomonas sp. TaxID=442121 RepID=A0A212LFS3_9HYPH|nr:hypothetical protein [uncultured Pleomorphomonas sp.]SCM76412.1 hypothetical protein KL86PLE_40217 [uncultured Pleomorphomonas sp.]
MGGLRDKLLHPDVIAAFVEAYQREYNAARQADIATRRGKEANWRRSGSMYHPSMKEKMSALEERRTAIEVELANPRDEGPLRLHQA